jgi:phosphoglycerol transferase MdoB-like AlkP superfamily enzyme
MNQMDELTLASAHRSARDLPADSHDHFALGLIALFLIPATFVAYTSKAAYLILGRRYFLDLFTFTLCFLLFSLLALSPKSRVSRALLMALVVLPPVIFHLANVLYYRFFADRMPFDIVYQIADIPHISTGVGEIWTISDLIYIIALPLFLSGLAVTGISGISKRRTILPLSIVAGILIALQFFIGPAAKLSAQEPFVLFIRQGFELLHEKYFGNEKLAILLNKREAMFPFNRRRYQLGRPEQGVFLKTPVKGATSASGLKDRPNIVIVLMESVRAFESGAYGAKISYTPCLDELAKDSLLFENYYANGFQTVRSEFSLLTSHYPNLGRGPHYLLNPYVQLISLPTILGRYGYDPIWISAYTADFEHKRRFLSLHGIRTIYDVEKAPQGKKIGWGLGDFEMFRWASDLLDRNQQPFFAEVMTLSNHFPFYSFPTDAQLRKTSNGERYTGYTRGIFYTDHAVGEFFRLARTKTWFRNTIFIITGDHGLFIFPDKEKMDAARRLEAAFRVPLLIYAPGRIQPGRRKMVASHVDVAPTILDLIGIEHPHTFLGRSLSEETSEFERFALMAQQNNWVMRKGDEFFYGGERDEGGIYNARPGDAYGEGIEWLRGGFRLQGDMLFGASHRLEPLPEDQSLHWCNWARDTFLWDRMALAKNWAFTIPLANLEKP